MGVERAVTRWYLQHQRISDEIAALEAKIEHIQQVQTEGNVGNLEQQPAEVEALQQLVDARSRLLALGPCPKPMMG